MPFEQATSFGPQTISQFVGGNDPLLWLPAPAADKLRLLEQRTKDLHAVIPETEDLNELRYAVTASTNRIKQLTASRTVGGFAHPEDHPIVVAEQKKLDATKAELKRLSDLSDLRINAWRETGYALNTTIAYLRDGGMPTGCTVELVVEEPGVKLAKGESSLVDAVENRRRRVRDLRPISRGSSTHRFRQRSRRKKCAIRSRSSRRSGSLTRRG
jgi:hypothetical protein